MSVNVRKGDDCCIKQRRFQAKYYVSVECLLYVQKIYKRVGPDENPCGTPAPNDFLSAETAWALNFNSEIYQRSSKKDVHCEKRNRGRLICKFIAGDPETNSSSALTTENQHNKNNNDNLNDTAKMLYVLTEMKNVFNMFGGLSNIYDKLRNANNPLDKLQVLLACFENSNSTN
ncbi:hypothetical protein CEXT_6171 [Caerostris extrusa]|uniref:Uncharacterized protein n=1 Tax=Caerostris extrusa TaxID=172846 RepID=A0AAV4VC85_CAEEX|nr:hypothetical protein CEXT_6171 [Caerostris extrusa]